MKFVLIFYNIVFIALYIPLALLGFIFTKRRTHFLQRLGIGMPNINLKSSFWFHAASVGEVRSLKQLITDIKQQFPDVGIVVSTISETGLATAKAELPIDGATLLPIENAIAMWAAFKRYGTKIFFITDTELWPNLISSIPGDVALVMLNGRISDKTVKKYNQFSFVFRPLLEKFTLIFAKSELDAERFREIAPKAAVKESINIKYRYNPQPLKPEFEKIRAEKSKIWFASSTHYPEEEIFIDAFILSGKSAYCIVAPRHIERSAELAEMIRSKGLSVVLYSSGNINAEVLIVDVFGVLEQLYQIADKIFIGGSIADIGGHNIFEALQYGKKVYAGIHMENFREITEIAKKYGLLEYIENVNNIAISFEKDDNTHLQINSFLGEIGKGQELFRNELSSLIKRYL